MDLLYAAILPSGADATQVLAYTISGNVDTFVAKMNELALKIGALNTHYVNTTGLDQDGAYSTISDQLLILTYALKNPTFRMIFTTKNYTLTNGLAVESTVNMYNRVLNLDISKIIGSKTGNTNDAGLCIAALFYHEDHEMLLITLGAERIDDVPYNLIDALTLIDTVNTSYVIPVEEVATLEEISVVNDVQPSSITIHYETIVIIVVFLFLVVAFFCRRVKK